MKKIIYSNYTKVIAVILFIASMVASVFTATIGLADYLDDEEQVYRFERDFSDTSYFNSLLVSPEHILANCYPEFYDTNEYTYNYYMNDNTAAPDTQTDTADEPEEEHSQDIEKRIEQGLSSLADDKINYYIEWNDKVFTNSWSDSVDILKNKEFYVYASKDAQGNVTRESSADVNPANYYLAGSFLEELSRYSITDTITVCASINDTYTQECKTIWKQQEAVVNDTLTKVFIFVIIALIFLIYLICVCGKNKDGEHTSIWVDNIWLEIHLAAICCFGVGAIAAWMILLDSYQTGNIPINLLYMSSLVIPALASGIILTSMLSIIRNIKRKRFIESSIILRIIRRIWKFTVKIFKKFYSSFKEVKKIILTKHNKQSGIILIGILLIYTGAIALCGLFTIFTPVWVLIGIMIFLFACYMFAYRTKDLDEVKKGISEIRNGNLTYKIPELKNDDMKILAEDINHIAKGLDESVAGKIKAERLKTDLITNVSHDLKTPLTSIISYTELLSKVENMPEEAKDYVKIIASKSDRLKNLTQDLFDISKAQSGNEKVVLEKIDVALLINQSLGEHDNEIKKSNLPFCVDIDKELYISADGRKMSRVIGNLISNILKYTLSNTRVFISAHEKDGVITMEFKNIASYPMDFDASEIVGRFVRGDKSRTAEGNGLGLAIAESYTRMCGGKFEIVTDGDLFKAVIKFDKY